MNYSSINAVLLSLRLQGCKHFTKPISRRFASETTEEIVIPKRIQRGSTDILRALASTVKPDPTAAHYKFHDDPYLIPSSNSSKRSYSLSYEAGRKAAAWILQEHADLFQHRVADPFIHAFAPKPIYDENSKVTENDLISTISNFLVSDSITVYNNLINQGAEISEDVKQSLLELLCYFNCEDTLSDDWIEERWYRARNRSRDYVKKTWKENSIAEQVFKSIQVKDSRAYCALICGLSAHGQLKSAYEYFEDAKSKNIPLSTQVYNGLIARVQFLRESHDLMWKLILDLLREMEATNIPPNLGTLNATLESLSVMAVNRKSNENALMTLAEFKALGISPSLASYYFLLCTFYHQRSNKTGILWDILDEIEKSELVVQDPRDTWFFTKAMEVACEQLRDKNIAYKIHNILTSDNNSRFIGDAYRESIYFRYFFTLICRSEPLEVFMKMYEELVPNIYIPEPSVMKEVLESIDINLGYSYLPKMWSDIVTFDQADREVLLAKLLELGVLVTEEELIPKMADIAWNIWERIENQKRERNLVEWTGPMLSNCMKIFLLAGQKPKANLVLDKLDRSRDSVVGEPSLSALSDFIDSCIQDNSPDVAIKCIKYMNDLGFIEAEQLAKKLHSSLTLNEQQKERIESIFGPILTDSK